jgi:hypothetical protein
MDQGLWKMEEGSLLVKGMLQQKWKENLENGVIQWWKVNPSTQPRYSHAWVCSTKLVYTPRYEY